MRRPPLPLLLPLLLLGACRPSAPAAPAGLKGLADGASWTDPATTITWIAIPGADYALSRSEITVDQYRRCAAAGACATEKAGGIEWQEQPWTRNELCNWNHPDRGDHPINCVDWVEADAVCRWAGGRTPTRQEWYDEASGGDDRIFPWGDEIATCERAVMNDWKTNRSGGLRKGCGTQTTWPVCSKPLGASRSGLCDLAGNLWEWTATQEFDDTPPRYNLGGSFENPADVMTVDFTLVNPIWSRVQTLGVRCRRAR
jgi:formylglycine-generating enzyme required for sulfatase activity